MNKPTVILATSNGIGMGHLARASAIAKALKNDANPIIVSMGSEETIQRPTNSAPDQEPR